MSRHPATPSQLKELERLFPGHELSFDARPFSSAEDIVKRFRLLGGDEMVVVAPWTVMREIIRLGVRPIYAEMKQIPCTSLDVEVRLGGRKRRCYRFAKFHYCEGVALTLVDIPLPSKGSAMQRPTVLLDSEGTTAAVIAEKEHQ